MHVFGEPVGRQIVSEAAFLGLAVDEGARRRELVAEPDIVDEAAHLVAGFATVDTADDELRQGRQRLEVDLAGDPPAAAFCLLLVHNALSHYVNWARFVPMDHDALRTPDRGRLDLRPLDRAQVHSGLDPASKKNTLERVRRAHRNVGMPDCVFRRRHGHDVDPEQRAHLGGEGSAFLRVGAEAAHGLDVAHGARRHQLCAGLPARAENAHARCVFACEIFDA